MPDRHLWTRHSTKTITFTGAADAGAQGNLPIFTVTGRVLVHALAAHTTANAASGGAATISLGVTGATSLFIAATAYTELVTTKPVWSETTGAAGGIKMPSTITRDIIVAANIVGTISAADITGGTIVFDVIYTPLTDGARLA